VGVAVNPGTFVYVVTNAYYGNQVHVIDTLTNSVAAPAFSVALSSPWGITFRPDGARGFVAGIGSNRLGIIDPGANSYLGETYTGAAPFEAVVSPDGARVYVTNVNGHSVSVINAVTYANIVDVPVGTNPYGIAINAAGTLVYAVNRTSETVSVIDTASNTVVGTVNLPRQRPLGIDLNLAGTLACRELRQRHRLD
jgi:YVTN family beta-propeller protein